MATPEPGLWKAGFGAVGVFLKALEDAGATLELLKLVRGNGDVAKAMVNAGKAFLRNRYADEEVKSTYTYPDNYAVKSIAEQVVALNGFFNLGGAKALTYADDLPELPEGAEGHFVIPRWQAVAKTYGKAVDKVLALIGKSRTLKNWREGQLGEKYLRQSERTEQMFAKFCEQQEGDIIIIPAQFGLLHRGRSVRRAREVFADNEFGLGLSPAELNLEDLKACSSFSLETSAEGGRFKIGVIHFTDNPFSFASIIFFAILSMSGLMHSRPRIAVALSFFKKYNQSSVGYGLQKCVILGDTACFCLVEMFNKKNCSRIKFKRERI